MYYNGLTQDEIVAGTDEGRLGIAHCEYLLQYILDLELTAR